MLWFVSYFVRQSWEAYQCGTNQYLPLQKSPRIVKVLFVHYLHWLWKKNILIRIEVHFPINVRCQNWVVFKSESNFVFPGSPCLLRVKTCIRLYQGSNSLHDRLHPFMKWAYPLTLTTLATISVGEFRNTQGIKNVQCS